MKYYSRNFQFLLFVLMIMTTLQGCAMMPIKPHENEVLKNFMPKTEALKILTNIPSKYIYEDDSCEVGVDGMVEMYVLTNACPDCQYRKTGRVPIGYSYIDSSGSDIDLRYDGNECTLLSFNRTSLIGTFYVPRDYLNYRNNAYNALLSLGASTR